MYLFNSTVLVEPTNICNLKCIMCEARCTVETGLNDAEYLLPEQLDTALKKLKAYISNVVFQGDCEPTLSPYLPELVKIARKYTEQIAIVTNGVALTHEKIDRLIENGTSWFAFSIDDYREKKYNAIRTYSSFKKVMTNLDYLIKIRDTMKKNIYIVTHKIIFQEDKMKDLEEYINFFYLKQGVNKITFAPIVKMGNIENGNWLLMRNELENKLISRGIQINLKDFANYPYMSNHKYCGTNLFFISHEGDFAPCGLHTRDKKIFGNLLSDEIVDIMKRKSFIEYHEYWYNKRFDNCAPEICKNCYLLRSPYFRYCLDDSYKSANAVFHNNQMQ
ncbi:MAG: radical SAM protein [Peptoanaerobacter stomatis]|uniref:radical SAM protein n=1 Tax=Peptoanaerobacter stomatis TaxID=796937 RepID=UPI003F9F43EC